MARFRNYSAGYYNVHWRVKATKDFNIPNGVHFVVNVKYNVSLLIYTDICSVASLLTS